MNDLPAVVRDRDRDEWTLQGDGTYTLDPSQGYDPQVGVTPEDLENRFGPLWAPFSFEAEGS